MTEYQEITVEELQRRLSVLPAGATLTLTGGWDGFAQICYDDPSGEYYPVWSNDE